MDIANFFVLVMLFVCIASKPTTKHETEIAKDSSNITKSALITGDGKKEIIRDDDQELMKFAFDLVWEHPDSKYQGSLEASLTCSRLVEWTEKMSSTKQQRSSNFNGTLRVPVISRKTIKKEDIIAELNEYIPQCTEGRKPFPQPGTAEESEAITHNIAKAEIKEKLKSSNSTFCKFLRDNGFNETTTDGQFYRKNTTCSDLIKVLKSVTAIETSVHSLQWEISRGQKYFEVKIGKNICDSENRQETYDLIVDELMYVPDQQCLRRSLYERVQEMLNFAHAISKI